MVKITNLPAVTGLTGAETVPVVQDGVSKRASIGGLAGYSYRKVDTYGDRASIPLAERSPGMLVKVVQAINQGDGTYRALWFTLNAADLTNSGWKLAPEFVKNAVAFTRSPIFSKGVLYFPGFYVLGYENSVGYGTYYQPSGGATYVASPGSTSNAICHHIFNKAAYQAGSVFEDCIIQDSSGAYGLRDTHDLITLAITRDGRLLWAADDSVIGDIPSGGAVANQFRYGKQPDNAPFIFPGCAPADITDVDLIALGFTRGIRGAPNSGTTIGGYLSEPLKVGDYIVCRFYLLAETAGVFGTPQIYIYTSEQAVNVPIIPVMLRQINSKVREYYYAGRLTAGGNGKVAIGSNNTANASRVWVVGGQFSRDGQPIFWINSDDYPDPVDCAPLMGDDLWMVSDRPLPLFPANGMSDRALEVVSEVTTTVIVDPDSGNTPKDAVAQAAQPYFDTVRDDGLLWLDPAQLAGQSLTLTMRAKAAAQTILTRILPVHVRNVPLGAPVNIKVGYFGDSHSASDFARYLRTYLAAWNINVTFYGTLDNAIGEKAGEIRQYGEGRGGWGIANFFGTYQSIGGAGSDPVWTSVLGPGSITAYQTGAFSVRQFTNPFLSNDGSSGSSAPVIAGALPLLGGGTASGFRFDLVNYRKRFGLPADLDFVLWEIGGNDQSQVGGAEALARINALWPAALAETRRAWPTAQIIGWAGATALTNDADIRWTERRPLYAAQLAAVRAAVAAGDTRMHYVSTWMHHTIRSGYPLAAGTVDSLTGATRTTLSDEVHTYWPARQQSLEALCAAIANLTGV